MAAQALTTKGDGAARKLGEVVMRVSFGWPFLLGMKKPALGGLGRAN